MWYCNNLSTYAAVRTFLMVAARYGKQAREAVTQLILVLLDTVLYDLRAVANFTEVPVGLLEHRRA